FEGSGHLRTGGGESGALSGRQGIRATLRDRAGSSEKLAVRALAPGQPGGYPALSRLAPARGRGDQVQPRETDRSGCRLAAPPRTEEGAEGMMERRAILTALAAGVMGSVVGARPGFAAEPPPETTCIRLSRYPFDVACVAPMCGRGAIAGRGVHDGS